MVEKLFFMMHALRKKMGIGCSQGQFLKDLRMIILIGTKCKIRFNYSIAKEKKIG